MNKAEMADRLAARTGLGKAVAREAVDGVFAIVGEALADGEEVRIAGFGTFGTRSRPARTGRNPRTGEAVSISASTSPTFRAGKTLKDAVKAGPGLLRCNANRPRLGAHQTASMWSPADCYAMTDTPRVARLAPGKAKPAAGLTDGLKPVWMVHRI